MAKKTSRTSRCDPQDGMQRLEQAKASNTYLAWVAGGCDSNHIWIENLLLKWNQHYLDDDVAALKKAVGVHGLGHVYGLWETTYSGCTNALNKGAIMRGGSWAWTTCGWNTPKIDDVAGVNAIY